MGRDLERQPKGRDGFPGQWTPWMFVHALHNQCKKHLLIPLICTYSDVPFTDVRIICTCTCTCIVLYPSVMTPLPTSTITTLTNPHTHVVAYMNSGNFREVHVQFFTSNLLTTKINLWNKHNCTGMVALICEELNGKDGLSTKIESLENFPHKTTHVHAAYKMYVYNAAGIIPRRIFLPMA